MEFHQESRSLAGRASSTLRQPRIWLLLALAACGDSRLEASDAERSPGDPAALAGANAAPLPGRSRSVLAGAVTGSVTLITGDRVVLSTINDRVVPKVYPGAGRDRIGFSVRERHGAISVLPEDVVAAVIDGRIDPDLFDVTRLLTEGYGDDRRDDLPLIITGRPELSSRLRSMASTDVIIDREWSSLHAAAARQRKASAGAVLGLVGAGAASARGATSASAAAGGARIWLDGHRKVLLDHSVPQIGAPAAHARGLTGAGITVAVLDSGIDTSHPDLAGKVAAAASFVDDGLGTGDPYGHGTHVASIVSGSGAASGGRFRGVAPDATLINGRVCAADGLCATSALLAGMEWAVVTQHAPIVNLSVGGPATPGIDPLEEAVNQLSAQYGTLFVIAAGNDGDRETVNSPGSADAALAVGAVDRDDQLAYFSSLGPRVGDHAIKPDITAPGVDITAARAAGTQLGPLVGDDYVQLSGTSMATPHVAGAAALLLEQHPDWTGEQLKATLMGTALPTGQSVYEQGAGRVDVDRATRQTVAAEPPSVSLGMTAFPHDHDVPITRIVTYRNPAAEPAALTLTAALSTGGTAAPDGMVAIAPSTVTVPAGGTAEVAVTVDTRLGIDGLYGGTLIASGGDVRVVTPFGVEREFEAHDLTVELVGDGGQPGTALLQVSGVGDPIRDVLIQQRVSGQTTLHLRRGTYLVSAVDLDSGTWLVSPRVAVAADAALTMDARSARPVDVTLPGAPELQFAAGVWTLSDTQGNGGFLVFSQTPLRTAEVASRAEPGELVSTVNVTLTTPGDRASDTYSLFHVEPDHFPTGWRDTLHDDQLATVEASYAGAEHDLFSNIALPKYPNSLLGALSSQHTGPIRRTEHYFSPASRWSLGVARVTPDGVPGWFTGLLDEAEDRDLVPGQHDVESWYRGPFSPAFAGSASPLGGPGAPQRQGDTLVLAPGLYVDQFSPHRHGAVLNAAIKLALLSNEQLLGVTTSAVAHSLLVNVPPDLARYRLEGQLSIPGAASGAAPLVTAAWSFVSQHADSSEILPLPTLRFSPALDEHNQTAARILALPIQIERPAGARTPRIARAAVEASFDDGATWLPVPIVGLDDRALGLIVHPPGTTFVSLRGSAADTEGNTVEQTVLRAYGVAPR